MHSALYSAADWTSAFAKTEKLKSAQMVIKTRMYLYRPRSGLTLEQTEIKQTILVNLPIYVSMVLAYKTWSWSRSYVG